MRIRLEAFLAFALVGCSAAPEMPVPTCHHKSRDCSSEAIQSRVIESFGSVKVGEILACAGQPAAFCNSENADEEACLVRMSPGALDGASAQSAQGSETPPLVLKLFRNTGEQQVPTRVFQRKEPGLHGVHSSIFANDERSLAVLHTATVHCIDISEIT